MSLSPEPAASEGSGAAPSAFTRWLSANSWALTLCAGAAAFGAYSCMYAFRKPFTSATYSGVEFAGLQYKVLLVLAQMLGYTFSKFAGIKFVSEAKPGQRVLMILGLIGFSELALLVFPLVPRGLGIVCLFLNGLPLGMVWGLVFSFLEGRRVTDLLGLGLSISFIVASGVMKSVGQMTMQKWGVNEFWMPAIAGALFIVPLLFFVYVLSQLPPPSASDIQARSPRAPMNRDQRRDFLRAYGVGIALMTLSYVGLSMYRDLRDTFMVEIFKDLGQPLDSKIFANVETRVGLTVLGVLAVFWAIRDNMRALWIYHVMIALGALLVGASTWAFKAGWISPFGWMFWTGVGSYLGYVPFNSVVFERLLAAFRSVGTAGFLIYIADSCGYAGSLVLYGLRVAKVGEQSWSKIMMEASNVVAIAVPICMLGSWLYFRKRQERG